VPASYTSGKRGERGICCIQPATVGITIPVRSLVPADRETAWMAVSEGEMVNQTCCYRLKMPCE
jgi:hypothetical protein